MTIQEKIKNSRGEAYGYAIVEAISMYGEFLKKESSIIIERTRKFTPSDIFFLSLIIDFPFKTTCYLCEKLSIVDRGTYDRIIEGKVTVKRLKQRFQEKMVILASQENDECCRVFCSSYFDDGEKIQFETDDLDFGEDGFFDKDFYQSGLHLYEVYTLEISEYDFLKMQPSIY